MQFKKVLYIFVFIGSVLQVHSEAELKLKLLAKGFDMPVDIVNTGGDKIFVVEKRGLIRMIDHEGKVLNDTLLDVRDRVNNSGMEKGLLGLAFHPDYDKNGYFFVNYTTSDSTHISRFRVDFVSSSNKVSNTEKVIMSVYQPFNNHNAGDLAFGPDSMLYIPLGDGGAGGDPGNRAQDSTELLGKILRINVNKSEKYRIPEDNPFVGRSSAREEIWALGLRNPWKINFDPKTNALWIADVGQDTWEEINREPAISEGGNNYGWRCYEGYNEFNPNGCSSESIYSKPVHVYKNTGRQGDCSITGGLVYRGSKFPVLDGHYFFADYCSGKIRSLYKNEKGKWVTNKYGSPKNLRPSTFGADKNGEMLIAGLNKGKIYRIQLKK